MVNTLIQKGKALQRKHIHTYKPWGGCKDIFDTREEEVLISGPAGTGKSRACLEKIFAVCLATPNVRALILRKTLASLGSTALVTWRKFVIKEALASGMVVYYGGSREEAPQYRFKNRSTVTIGGLDRPTRIMSSEYDIIYVQEATEITLDDLETIKTRLRNWQISFQQLIMDCNPAGDKHWLKLRCDDKLCRLIESRHEDNPRLFNEDGTLTKQGVKYIKILDALTGVRYKRLRLGLWVSAEGIIYEQFDPATHVLPWQYDEDDNKLPLPEDWPRYWVIDFGFVHPFVLKCYAVGPDDEHYMYREIYMTQRTVQEHAKTIMDEVTRVKREEWFDHFNKVTRIQETIEWIEPQPFAVICDHDAEDRRTFENATGLSTIPANKKVVAGINAHMERLKIRPETGEPQFYLMADSLVELDQSLRDRLLPTCTKEEYACYTWHVKTDGSLKDEPNKENDDGMDCDRYHTAYHDLTDVPRYSIIEAS